MSSLRERNRLAAMRLTQRRALDLFESQGFEAVTVTQIADDVGIAPSTLYRYFETKEAMVLWDEHEPSLEAALERELHSKPPLEAMRRAFVEELGDRYEADNEFQLRRVQYIYATERLHAAAAELDFRNRVELTAALEQVLSSRDRESASLLAGASLLALDVAFGRWQASNARRGLGSLIEEAFEQLTRLSAIR